MLNIDICIPTVRGVPDQIVNNVLCETRGSVFISGTKPLVKARMELIKKVETPLMLFLDDDIVYPDNLLHNLYNFLMSSDLPFEAGAVQGQTVPYGLGENWDRALSDAVKFKGFKVMRYGQRLMTSNLLTFTHLVKDWKPLNDCSGCEDLSLTKHIQDKGVKCVKVPIYVKHKRSWDKVRSNSSWYANGFYMVEGKRGVQKHIIRSFLSLGKYVLTLPFNPYLSIYTIVQNVDTIKAMAKVLLFE